MNGKLILLFIALSLTSCRGNSQTQASSNMIPIEKIKEMYSNMHSAGVDTDEKMLYGYFFTNSEPKQLEKVSEQLKKDSFDYVDIYQNEDGLYWLHMERIEIHNANSLFELNKKLYAVADKFKITSYDGYDVGNADKNEAIKRDTYAVPEEFGAKDLMINDMPLLLIANKAFEHFPHKEEYYYFAEIKTNYAVENASKLPTETELEVLNDFEEFIEANLTQNKISNYYIGRTTHNAERVMYFVTNESPKSLLEYISENGNQRKFEYKVTEDKDWKVYSELIDKLK